MPVCLSACHNAAMHPDALNQALGHTGSDKRLEVLRRVAQSGSISQAARDAGVSYKAAWQAIDTLTTLSGVELVQRTVGGAGGGGAQVTQEGLQLLTLADELALARRQVLDRFSGSAGLAGGLGLRTSMRNQLPCEVVEVTGQAGGDPVLSVRLRTPGGLGLLASLTHESADLLGIGEGLQVLALSKATAVRVVPREDMAGHATSEVVSCLPGAAVRVSKGPGWTEVVMALAGGGSWVGFAQGERLFRVGDPCLAWVDASAVVIALSR